MGAGESAEQEEMPNDKLGYHILHVIEGSPSDQAGFEPFFAIIPDRNWSGEGSLGCNIGYGYLHRIPKKRFGETESEENGTIEEEVVLSSSIPKEVEQAIDEGFQNAPLSPPPDNSLQ